MRAIRRKVKHTFNSTRYIRNRGVSLEIGTPRCPFNSTRYIRNRKGSSSSFPRTHTFNSTRYIRNRAAPWRFRKEDGLSTPHGTLGTKQEFYVQPTPEQLSTPHGTLGTKQEFYVQPTPEQLSTPHGTLGTRDILRKEGLVFQSFNSTRYIRNSFVC